VAGPVNGVGLVSGVDGEPPNELLNPPSVPSVGPLGLPNDPAVDGAPSVVKPVADVLPPRLDPVVVPVPSAPVMPCCDSCASAGAAVSALPMIAAMIAFRFMVTLLAASSEPQAVCQRQRQAGFRRVLR
jgi:hypothetical protein